MDHLNHSQKSIQSTSKELKKLCEIERKQPFPKLRGLVSPVYRLHVQGGRVDGWYPLPHLKMLAISVASWVLKAKRKFKY